MLELIVQEMVEGKSEIDYLMPFGAGVRKFLVISGPHWGRVDWLCTTYISFVWHP